MLDGDILTTSTQTCWQQILDLLLPRVVFFVDNPASRQPCLAELRQSEFALRTLGLNNVITDCVTQRNGTTSMITMMMMMTSIASLTAKYGARRTAAVM